MIKIKSKLLHIISGVWFLNFFLNLIIYVYNDYEYSYYIFSIIENIIFLIVLFIIYNLIMKYILEIYDNFKESENKYKKLFQNLPSAFSLREIIVDENNKPINFKFLETNSKFEELIDLKNDDVIGKTILEIERNVDQTWIEKYGNVALNGDLLEIEYFNTFNNRIYNITSYCPEIGKFATIFTDITDRKKIEDQLKLNTLRLKLIIEIFEYSANSIQEFLDYSLFQAIKLTNSKYGYIYHYNDSSKQFILNTWSKDVMSDCEITNPLTVYDLEKTGIWGETIRQNRPIIVNNFQDDNPLKKGYPKGHVELLNFMTVPTFKDDKIVGVMGLANKYEDYDEQDVLEVSLLMNTIWKITDKIKSDKELLDSELKYRELFKVQKCKNVDLQSLNNELNCLYNITEIIQLELGFEETINCIIKLIPSSSCDEYINVKINIDSKEFGTDLDIPINPQYCSEIKCDDGICGIITIWCSNLNSEFPDTKIKLFDDIVKRLSKIIEKQKSIDLNHELKEKVNLSDRMSLIGMLSSNIVHNFNNLLHSLILNISIMQQMIEIKTVAEDNLKNMELHISEMQNIISELLMISKGSNLFSPVNIDIYDFIISQANLFKTARIDLKIEIIKKYTNGLYVLIDINCFKQIFLNLFINAYQAMHDNDEKLLSIEIESVSRDYSKLNGLEDLNYIKISITDNGCGIDTQYLSKIFDPFFTTKKTGSGLGLSTIYNTIKKHNGVIGVKSEKNKFTTFEIYLPKIEISQDLTLFDETEKVILLVDDDPSLLKMFKKILKDTNYVIIDFFDPKKALDEYKLNYNKIDMVITDFSMPIINGEQFIKICKDINPNCKCLLMSGYPEGQFEQFLKEFDNVEFLNKLSAHNQLIPILLKL